MTPEDCNGTARMVYRVDRFSVPAEGRAEFLGRVAATHALLRRQQGFVRDLVLENPSRSGVCDFVTVVEWESAGAIEPAAAAVRELHARTGFDRAEMFSRLGIEAAIGLYRPVER